MATPDLKSIAKQLDGIEKRLEKLEPPKTRRSGPVHRFTNPPVINPPQPQMSFTETVKVIPVELDWLTPPVRTTARVLKSEDGRVRMILDISGEDAAIVEELIESQPVTALQLSSVQPR